MKKIGFIDYYIDEWHANNYPNWIRESKYKDEFEVSYAYEMICPEGKTNIDKWCENFGVEKCDSIEEVVEKSDCIVVLSPDNPEMHEKLSQIPLKSGKPTYIDKTFATSYKEAKRIIDLAKENNTPMYSSSALRFADEILNIDSNVFNRENIDFVSVRGPGVVEIYLIHQIEPLVKLMGVGAESVMNIGTENTPAFSIKYKDGRKAMVNHITASPFSFALQNKDGQTGLVVNEMTNHFPNFIDAMLEFFKTEKSKVPFEEILECMALIECCNKALKTPYEWVYIDNCK